MGSAAVIPTPRIPSTSGVCVSERSNGGSTDNLGESTEEYPEGGLRAWMVVLGAWCAMIPSMGMLNSLAILEAWLSEHDLQGIPKSTTGWVLSTYAFFLFFCGAQIGPIFDSYDVRWLIIPGSVGMIASMICMSFSKEFYQYLLSFGVLGGISASFLYNPGLSTVGHWFQKRRGLATCIACTSGGIGGVWIPLVILYLAPRVGFPWAIRVVALISAVHLVVACCLLRQRLPPNKKAGSSIDLKALADPMYGTITIALVLVEFSIFIPISYISSYGLQSGFNHHQAYMLNAYLNAGAIPGRALPGYVADRFGVMNTMCAISFFCMLFIFCLWYTAYGNQSMIISFAVLFGFWSGASVSLAPVGIGLVCKTEDYGKRNGTAYTLASFGTLIGIPIGGALLGAEGKAFQGLIIFSGASYIFTLGAYFLGRGLLSRWRLLTVC
ncbi:unnamed protein product [Clonostachys chloroleuca]|uniref:Major facilitator superfamily (MFS) profile domain-containing protein n=1 Tax=Clonostachys chloroleuca TaxID=1926264 RepID=A0AA35VRV3_9HYPO|nr:unnamed protein product [Clonostachys chloroleuca]